METGKGPHVGDRVAVQAFGEVVGINRWSYGLEVTIKLEDGSDMRVPASTIVPDVNFPPTQEEINREYAS